MMRLSSRWARGAVLASLLLAGAGEASAQGSQQAHRGDVMIELDEGPVPDPYRWMEVMDSPDVVEWADARDSESRTFAASYAGRDALARRIAAAADHERYLAPLARGSRYFYARVNSSFTRVSILVQNGLDGAPIVLVDGDLLARNGLVADISIWPSPDGRVLAYGVAREGSRWLEIRFRDVETGRDLPDRIRGLQGRRLSHLSWTSGGDAVFYDGFEPPSAEADELAQQLVSPRLAVHRMGDHHQEDDVVLEADGPGTTIRHWLTDDGAYVVAAVRDGSTGTDRVHVFPADRQASGRVVAEGAPYEFAGSSGSEIWLYTTSGAMNGRVVGIDPSNPDPSAWRNVVVEQEAAIDTWTGIRAVGDRLIGGYRKNGRLELRSFIPGEPAYDLVDLPRIGSVWFGVVGRQGDPEFFFVLSGFADPGTVYRHDLSSGRTTIFRAPDLPFDPDRVVTRLIEYPSADGRSAPMYVAHLEGTELGSDTPVMMYGYGFGGWSVSPWFRPHMFEWFRMGGAFVLPALRGGGEFGEAWMRAAMRERRQTAVDDFVAAAEWLISRGLVTADRLIAETNSAGGPVVGAAIVQRPDLFAAALFGFPLLDLLRYDAFTGGARWIDQLGTVSDPSVAPSLAQLSPVHNVKPGSCYPATLVAPGERDETTPPFHAYKFVAALRHGQGCDAPIMLRLSRGAGHSYGRDQATTIDGLADQLAFVARVLGLEAAMSESGGSNDCSPERSADVDPEL